MSVRPGRIGPLRSVEEKLEIVAEYEQAPRGRKGEVLRRYGTARATVANWAYLRDHDEFGPSRSGRRQRKPERMTPRPQSAEIARLRRQLAKAQAEQEVLKAALETVGKAHALLESISESAETEPLQQPPSERRRSGPSSPMG